MVKLTFVTGNEKKLAQARLALIGYDIEITNQKIDTPEIQDTDLKKIAEFSSKHAASELGNPVVVTDAGYYIEALNGFPGPFIKFVNQWFSPEELLKLMEGKKNRKVISPICISYCEPNGTPVSFISNNEGFLSESPEGEGSAIDRLYIPKGYQKPIGTLSEEEKLSVWNMECWKELAEYLKTHTPENSPA